MMAQDYERLGIIKYSQGRNKTAPNGYVIVSFKF
jgi:hypothetical protein